MAKRTKPSNSKIAAPANQPAADPLASVVKESLKWLEARGSQAVRDTIGPKYGIQTEQSFGVPVSTIHELASELKKTHGPKGTNMRHELAHALWETGPSAIRRAFTCSIAPSMHSIESGPGPARTHSS